MKDRGYVLTWDALIALIFVLLILAGFLSIPYLRSIQAGEAPFQQVHVVTEDAMEVSQKRGALTEAGRQWQKDNYSSEEQLKTGTILGASEILREQFDPIVPPHMGYRIMVDDEVIYSTDWDPSQNRPTEPEAKDKTRAIRLVSGYRENASASKWFARAALFQNNTRYIHTLRYGGQDLEVVVMQFPVHQSEIKEAYLVVPLDARMIDAKLNLTRICADSLGVHLPPTMTTTSTSTTSTTSTTTTAPPTAFE